MEVAGSTRIDQTSYTGGVAMHYVVSTDNARNMFQTKSSTSTAHYAYWHWNYLNQICFTLNGLNGDTYNKNGV
jgi:hypothetical protein